MGVEARIFEYNPRNSKEQLVPKTSFREGEKGIFGHFNEVWDYCGIGNESLNELSILVFAPEIKYFEAPNKKDYPGEIPHHRFHKYLFENISHRLTEPQEKNYSETCWHHVSGGEKAGYQFRNGILIIRKPFLTSGERKHYIGEFLINSNNFDLSQYKLNE